MISASVLGQASYPYVLKQFAGNDLPGDGGAATSALLVFGCLAVADSSGNLYIYDNGRFRVVNAQRVINATSAIPPTTVSDFKFAADGTLYIGGTLTRRRCLPDDRRSHQQGRGGEPSASAKVYWPHGVAVGRLEDFYAFNHAQFYSPKAVDGNIGSRPFGV